MTFKALSPDSRQLTFICGLGWPQLSRYFLSHREDHLWEFWEQPPGSREANLVFGWVAPDHLSETDVAKRLLASYLGTFRSNQLPQGERVQGLLSIREIRRVLRRHREHEGSSVLRFPVTQPSGGQPAA